MAGWEGDPLNRFSVKVLTSLVWWRGMVALFGQVVAEALGRHWVERHRFLLFYGEIGAMCQRFMNPVR